MSGLLADSSTVEKPREAGRGTPNSVWRSWLALGLVLAVGLVARLLLASGAPVFLEGDSQSYLLPGWELAQGSGLNPELRRAPGYPAFIAASFTLLGRDLETLALAQHALGLATAALAFLLARRLFGTPAGLVAGLAIAISGPQLIYERYVMTEALFGFVLTVAALAMVATLSRRTTNHERRWMPSFVLAAGALIAVAALTRPVAQAVLPLFIAALLLGLPRWRPALKAAGLALLGYGLVIAPWSVRNLLAHETLSTAGGLGRSLIARTVKYDQQMFDWKWLSETYGGREDEAGRARMLLYRKRANIPASRSVRPYQDALIEELGVSPARAEALMREVALEAIGRKPLYYVAGSLGFTGELFRGGEERLQSHWKQRANKDWDEQWDDRLDVLVEPVAGWQAPTGGNAPSANAYQAMLAELTGLHQPARLAWPLALLFLGGCLVAARDPARRPALLLSAVVVVLLGLSAFLDGPVPRYRHPLDPLIMVLVSAGLVGLGRAVVTAARRWRTGLSGQRRVREGLRTAGEAEAGIPSPLGRGLG